MIVKTPLFRNPVLGFLLRRLCAIPAHRRQDMDSVTDPARNAEMFSTATATLAKSGAILIFPEGTSHEDPTLPLIGFLGIVAPSGLVAPG